MQITDLKEIFEENPSDIAQALAIQYKDSFNSSPAEYWLVLGLFIVIPLVVAGFILTKKTQPR